MNVSHQSSEDIRGKCWFHLRMQNPISVTLYLVIFRVIAIFLIKYLRTMIIRRTIVNVSSLTLKTQKANI